MQTEKTFIEKLKDSYFIILIVLALIGFGQTCAVQSKLSKVASKNEVLVKSVDSLKTITVSKEFLDSKLRENLYKSLILEEDIDKGVVSISEIKKEQLKNEQ